MTHPVGLSHRCLRGNTPGAALADTALAQVKVVFATNLRAKPGHGGSYQALADGF